MNIDEMISKCVKEAIDEELNIGQEEVYEDAEEFQDSEVQDIKRQLGKLYEIFGEIRNRADAQHSPNLKKILLIDQEWAQLMEDFSDYFGGGDSMYPGDDSLETDEPVNESSFGDAVKKNWGANVFNGDKIKAGTKAIGKALSGNVAGAVKDMTDIEKDNAANAIENFKDAYSNSKEKSKD